MRLLVTGASGLLGSAFLHKGLEMGSHVYGYRCRPGGVVAGLQLRQADFAARGEAQRVIESVKPDVVIHCAALTDVDHCESHPDEAERVNGVMAGLLAKAACAHEARFVYISTDAVFDGVRGNYEETDPPAPQNVYGHTKLLGETLVRDEYPRALILRTNLFGWRAMPESKPSLAEWFIAGLESGKRIAGFTDVRFSPVFTYQLCDFTLQLVRLGAAGTFHVGARDSSTKYEFGVQLAQAFGLDEQLIDPIHSESVSGRAPRAKVTSLNSRKLEQTLGCEMPRISDAIHSFKLQRPTPIRGGQ